MIQPENWKNDDMESFFKLLKNRFVSNKNRHPDVEWEEVANRLIANPEKIQSLFFMEATGGEPDVVSWDDVTKQFIFMDCCAETPLGRRNVCYDKQALDSRKEHKPSESAVEMAMKMGARLLREEEYFFLQEKGVFDLTTSSWIQTPQSVRKRGGALFGDRRYDRVFVYHNGASSYYGVRGFRCVLYV